MIISHITDLMIQLEQPVTTIEVGESGMQFWNGGGGGVNHRVLKMHVNASV